MKSNTYINTLRTLHGIFAFYFILCIIYIYYVALVLNINTLLYIAVSSLIIEGFIVFILNGGNCPLIYLQRRVNDPVPFFNLFLPDHLAKIAIPFFTAVTFFGIFLLVLRLILSI